MLLASAIKEVDNVTSYSSKYEGLFEKQVLNLLSKGEAETWKCKTKIKMLSLRLFFYYKLLEMNLGKLYIFKLFSLELEFLI